MSSSLIIVPNSVSKKSLPLYISNKIIEAHFSLPLGEQRLLFTYISQIKEKDLEFHEMKFNVRDFTEMLELSDPNYSNIKNNCKKILDRLIEIETEDEWIGFHWFSVAKYHKKEGAVTLKIHDQLKPYLLRLKKEFTRLVTKQVLRFKSVYSIRIYMFCKQYQALGKRKITLLELRKSIGIKEDEYKRYFDFKKRVILQAQKEINRSSDIEIEFNEFKKERRVVEIIFFIGENISNIDSESQITLKSPEDLAKMLSKEIYKRWEVEFPVKTALKYKRETINELICAILGNGYKNANIKNPVAYFRKSLDKIEMEVIFKNPPKSLL